VESVEKNVDEEPVRGLGATTATKLVTGKHSFRRGRAWIDLEADGSEADFIWRAPAEQRELVRSFLA
jgi:hypothetical protein